MRAADPVVLGAWYRDCLGLDADENGLWRQEAGPTVFAAFEPETDYFGSRAQQVMLNFRVRDLDAMLAQLRAKGADVAEETQSQVVEHVLADPPGEDQEGTVGEGGDRHRADQDGSQGKQDAEVRRAARPDAQVDREADQEGDGKRRGGLQDDQRRRLDERPAVGTKQDREQASHAHPEDPREVGRDLVDLLSGDPPPAVDRDLAQDARSSASWESSAR